MTPVLIRSAPPGLRAPAAFFAALALMLASVFGPPAQARQDDLPPPDMLNRLVWSAMIAVDNANRTGDYAVLRKLGTAEFQRLNSEQALADTFATLRENRVDVGRAVTISPSFDPPPGYLEPGVMRLRGGFEFRPQAIRFDLIFVMESGGWRLGGISVAQMENG